MTCAANYDVTICKGKTFNHVLRWSSSEYVYKVITSITQAAPAVITAVGHGVPEGWPVAVTAVKGMLQINAKNAPPLPHEYTAATVLSTDTIGLNAVNAALFKPYTSGGVLQYRTPVDLSGYTARMSIKDRTGGTELLRLDTTNGRIELDNTAKTITLTIDADDTADIDWRRGVYDLELVSAGGVVSALLAGIVTVTEEVTTS
jgi:hypothetical protein